MYKVWDACKDDEQDPCWCCIRNQKAAYNRLLGNKVTKVQSPKACIKVLLTTASGSLRLCFPLHMPKLLLLLYNNTYPYKAVVVWATAWYV